MISYFKNGMLTVSSNTDSFMVSSCENFQEADISGAVQMAEELGCAWYSQQFFKDYRLSGKGISLFHYLMKKESVYA